MAESFNEFLQDWKNCTRCPLGVVARKHVLFECVDFPGGSSCRMIPPMQVDVMLVGEGPGVGEDIVGKPFIGPAGKLLRRALAETLEGRTEIKMCLTNLLACRPFLRSASLPENRPPAVLEVEACAPRLAYLLGEMQPSLVLAAGLVPDEFLPAIMASANCFPEYRKIKHPSWVLRQKDQSAFDFYVVELKHALEVVW